MTVKWNYTSAVKQSSGYEDVLDTLKTYTQEKYLQATEKEQQRMVDEVYAIYRLKNIFPITYFNEEGMQAEIQKCIDKVIEWDGNVLDMRFTQGSALCKYLMPNMFDVVVRDNPDTQYKRFYQEEGLKKAIAFCLRYDTGVKPNQVQAGLRMTSSVATNFPPMKAKAIYEHFTPKNGAIYDYAHGFGGRMLGALSSKNNYTYVGVDPNSETFANVQQLGHAIERTTGRVNSWQTYCMGSEEAPKVKEGSMDFAFSSPPYFFLERYSEEETQSYNKYPELEDWIENYVRPTIQNIYDVLKDERYYCVNIADFKIGNKQFNYVDRWIEISEEVGFAYVRDIPMKLQKRTGNRHIAEDKKEGVFVFYKGDKPWLTGLQ